MKAQNLICLGFVLFLFLATHKKWDKKSKQRILSFRA